MGYEQFTNLVKKRKQTILIITVLFLIVVALITFTRPLKYSATSQLLVVQNYGPNTDAYNVSRSNQFLSNLLAQVVYSDSFYEKVQASGFNLASNFSADPNQRKKEWSQTVYTKAVADTGMIIIKTYHQDKKIADRLNQAIAFTLITKHGQYHGLGDSVQVKIIDNSTLSNWPVKPNVILNLLLGLIVGLAASFYFIYLFPNKAINFSRGRHAGRLETLPEAETELKFVEQPAYETVQSEPVYQTAEILNEVAAMDDELKDLEEADEFEPFFKGSINNVIPR